LRYFLDPFGCVKNQVDAENMMAHLNQSGWENVSDADAADLIIVHSCGFIESAKQESINAVLSWRKNFPGKKILLAGCLAERYAKELSASLPEADGFFGVKDISKITDAVSVCLNPPNIKPTETPRKSTGFYINRLVSGERPLLSLPGSAYVKISEGCNNRCSFCAIPMIRGSLICRTIPDIVDECRVLISRGIRELCIIGQDIGSYTYRESGINISYISGLPELLQAVSGLEGNFWIRLLYIHPDHFPLGILDIMERDKRFLPYFDIPFQHASAKILSAMNRKDSAEQYLALLETIRARLPDAVIRSTFLLGFPGETEGDFSALLDFQEAARLDWLGCFAYSREEGTAAYSMKNRVSAKIAAQRKQLVEERQIPITEKNMERFVGKTMDVLIEEQIGSEDANEEDFWLGRLYCHAPEIDGAAVIVNNNFTDRKDLYAGNIFQCKVIALRGFDLEVIITRYHTSSA
jgi:ribosomal protein S12 methylthiotransferase